MDVEMVLYFTGKVGKKLNLSRIYVVFFWL